MMTSQHRSFGTRWSVMSQNSLCLSWIREALDTTDQGVVQADQHLSNEKPLP